MMQLPHYVPTVSLLSASPEVATSDWSSSYLARGMKGSSDPLAVHVVLHESDACKLFFRLFVP